MNNHVPHDEERPENRISTRGIVTAGIICLLIITVAIYLCINAYNNAAAPSDVNSGIARSVPSEVKESIPKTTNEIKPYNSEAVDSMMAASKSLPQSYYDSSPFMTSEDAAQVEAPAVQEEVTFMAPLSGEVLRSFSDDALVFSNTLNDWRTHEGIDYAAEIGAPVSTVADGTVSDFYYDDLYGNVMTITHPDGYESTLCGLNDIIFFRVGDEVKQGEVVGTVGDSLPIEGSDASHLHLEITKDGEYLNPASLIG